MDEQRILDKLASLETKIDELRATVHTMNGIQQAHTAWIAARNQTCEAHLLKTELLTAASSQQHDYQTGRIAERRALKPLLIGLWTVTVALAAAIGAWVDRVLK